MKYLKIFIFIMILFFNFNVFASNTNVSNKIKYSTDSAKGTYEGDEIYLGGYNGRFSVGTRYNGRLAMLSFYLSTDDYNFTTNHTYTITLNMATEDWRNNFMGPQVIESSSNGSLGSSLSVSNFRFVSYKQIKFNFKTDSSLPTYIFFRVYSTDYANPNGGITAITGTNNWNLSSIYIDNNVASTPTPAPVTPTPSPTPQPNNQDIINNATQNTQDIINNQNNNTNNIIENNDKNTTDIIDNANSNTQAINDTINNAMTYACPNLIYVLDTSYHQNCTYSPELLSVSCYGFDFDTYFSIVSLSNPTDDFYTLSFNADGVGDNIIYYYVDGNANNRKQLKDGINTITISRGVSLDHGVVMFDNYSVSAYASTVNFNNFILTKGKDYIPWCLYGTQVSKLDGTNQAINNLTDTMKDDSISPDAGNDFFDDFENNMHGLSGIITIPLSYIQSLSNTQCSPLHIPIPFTNNKYLDLPCMTSIYEQHIPTLLVLIQTCWYGILAYKVLIDIFGIVKGFKDPDSDKIEVMDL